MLEQHIKPILENSVGYAWFVFLAIWGGTASYISKLKKEKGNFSIAELLSEWSISGFSGIVTAYFCQSYGVGFYMTAALVAISGHMGGRTIYIIESIVESRAKKIINQTIGKK